MTAKLRLLCVVLAFLTLSGCSSLTFFYNRLDFLIPWYVERKVDLDRPQKIFLKEQLQPFLAWHRSVELPRYRAILMQIEQDIDQPLTAASVIAVQDQIDLLFQELDAASLGWMLALGEQLSEAQLDELNASLREEQQEYEEELLERDREEYLEENRERMEDTLKDFLGRLNTEQEAKIAATVTGLQRMDKLWLEQRDLWLQQLEGELAREPGWQTRIRELSANREANYSEAYHVAYQHNLGLYCGMIAEVVNSRTEKQDRTLRRKLRAYIEDLDELIADAAGPEPK